MERCYQCGGTAVFICPDCGSKVCRDHMELRYTGPDRGFKSRSMCPVCWKVKRVMLEQNMINAIEHKPKVFVFGGRRAACEEAVMTTPSDKNAAALRERLVELEAFACEKGAYRARVFPASGVAIDERVRMKCQIPLCPHYGRTLTCPPHVPGVEEFRRVVGNYHDALLVQTRSLLSGVIDSYDKEEVRKFFVNPAKSLNAKGGESAGAHADFSAVKIAAARLHKLVNEVESKAMAIGFPFALGLIGGECMLCPTCVGPGAKEGCRRPFEARPSMEGVGIDVLQTCVNAGLPFDMPPKTEIVWSGLLLIQ